MYYTYLSQGEKNKQTDEFVYGEQRNEITGITNYFFHQ